MTLHLKPATNLAERVLLPSNPHRALGIAQHLLEGPRMFNHVKCAHCYTTFNAKTGQSNNTAITIYVIVGFMIALILGVIVGVLPNLK